MGLPRGTPTKYLDKIFEDTVITADTMNDKNLAKVNIRFETDYDT